MKVIKHPVISELPSADLAAPGIIRTPRGANPVNAGNAGHRETRPMQPMANPRVKHPKLNKESWVTSYAQARTEPRMARPKARTARSRRQARDKRR